MDGAWLARARWRRRGAWMWPMFAVLIVVDGLIGSTWPPSGESWNGVGAALLACFLNLFAIVVVSVPVSLIVRRVRPDLPKIVARDYAATIVMLCITAIFLTAGLAHHARVMSDRRAMTDAISRAQAFIGDRAPAEFRRNLSQVDTFTIEPGRVYRTCVPNRAATREYCVIVRTALPFAESVRFDGYEPNSVFAQGVN
jgi:hypothetical protein